MLSLPMGVAVVDAHASLLGANPSFADLVKMPADALPGLPLDALAERLPDHTAVHVRKALEAGAPVLSQALDAPPGHPHDEIWLISCYPVLEDGRVTAALAILAPRSAAGTTFDVHEALRRAETRYTLATTATADAVWDWHLDSGEIYWNENIATLFGHDLSTVTPDIRWWERQLHPDDRDRVMRELDEALDKGDKLWSSEYRFRRGDGSWAIVLDRGAVLRDDRGRALHMVGAMQDVTAVRQAQADLELLANASERLSESLDVEQTLQDLVHLAVPTLADWALVDLCEEGGLTRRVAVAAPTPADVALGYELAHRYPAHTQDDSGIAAVIRTRQPQLFSDLSDVTLEAIARDAQHLAILRRLDLRSYLVVPLLARGATVGVLALATGESGRRFGPHELRLAQDLARRTSLAIENAMLFDEAHEAAERMSRLQAVTAAMARAVTPADIADALVSDAPDAIGARSAAIYLVDDTAPPGSARLVAARGLAVPTLQAFALLHPDDRSPGSRALRTGKAVWVETPDAMVLAFPEMAVHIARSPSRAWAAVPICLGERVLGVITMGLGAPTRFRPEQRELLLTLGQVAGQALERAHLFEARRKAEERLRLALEAAAIGTWEFDVATEMMHGDQRTYAIVDGPRGPRPAHYRQVLRMVHPDDREGVERLRKQLLAGVAAPLRWVGRITVMDGSQRWVELCGQAVLRPSPPDAPADADPVLARVIGTVIDVTAAKQAEVERERLLDELRVAVTVRDEFISLASHELKTPLTAVDLQLQLLLRATRPGAPPAASDPRVLHGHAQSAVLSLNRLNELINRLLDVTRLSAGPPLLMPHALDLADVAREVVARFRPEADGAGSELTLTLSGDLHGQFDRMRIDQILSNLLSNALRYGGGQPVAVSLTREGDEAILQVRDQGIGVAQHDRARIFNRFERAVSGARYAGLGVGLWVVSEIVRAMGGTISVDSEVGRGSTFIVHLPIQ